jgi:hypothetical protein
VVFVDDGVVVDPAAGWVVVEAGSAFAGAAASSVDRDPPSAPSAEAPLVDDAGAARRSFLAQPEPL